MSVIASGSGGGGSGGGVTGLATADGGTAIADNKVVRGDGATGIQGSVIDITDAGVVASVTQLNVDNLRLDGNTLSSTDSNGSVTLDPDGTGNVLIASGLVQLGGTSAAFPALKRSGTGVVMRAADDSLNCPLTAETLTVTGLSAIRQVEIANNFQVAFSDGVDFGRGIAGSGGIAGVTPTNGSTGAGALVLREMASAPAAVANAVVLFAQDNGAGKTQLMMKFPTGAAVPLGMEL